MEELKRITGISEYKGMIAQQHENAYSIFKSFLAEIKPKRILEIGAGSGVFTLFLKDTLEELGLYDTKIKTFEVNPIRIHDILLENNIEILDINIFDHSYMKLEKPEYVVPFIQEEGTTLVLCDGGHKVAEFRELSKYIKNGDYIMAHDYATTTEYFEEHINNKIWLWLEIQDYQLEDVFIENNLVSYNQEEFQKIVWLCRKKVNNG